MMKKTVLLLAAALMIMGCGNKIEKTDPAKGSITMNLYYTGKDGTKKKAYEVLISQASFCGGKKDNAPSGTANESNAGTEIPNVEEFVKLEEDLPF